MTNLDQVKPRRWKKIGVLTVKADDGSKVWLDKRGLIGLERPDGYYVTFGASYADGREFDYTSKLGMSPKDRDIRLYVSKEVTWEKNGYDTGKKIPQATKQALLDCIRDAIKILGFITSK